MEDCCMNRYMDGVVGNQKIRQKLCSDIFADKLPHAMILEGAFGTGKHTIAMNVAAALACSNKKNGKIPCYACPQCKKIFDGNSPDIITFGCEGKTTFSVDSVRHIKDDIRTVPNDLDFKLYIIEDTDKMTSQAQNAFLLTLEEPPSFVRFILLCENAELLLETIRSRAPVLRTEPIENSSLDEFLCRTDRRAAQMKLSSPREYEELIIASKNGIGTALNYLEPKNFAPVKDIRTLATDFCNVATSSQNAKNILLLLNRFSQKREVLLKQLVSLSEAITDLLLLKKSDDPVLAFFADKNYAIELCDRVSMSFLFTLNNSVLEGIDKIQKNANVRLTLLKIVLDANIM